MNLKTFTFTEHQIDNLLTAVMTADVLHAEHLELAIKSDSPVPERLLERHRKIQQAKQVLLNSINGDEPRGAA